MDGSRRRMGGLKNQIQKALDEVKHKTPQERTSNRIEKYGKMGFWEETTV